MPDRNENKYKINFILKQRKQINLELSGVNLMSEDRIGFNSENDAIPFICVPQPLNGLLFVYLFHHFLLLHQKLLVFITHFISFNHHHSV